MAIQRRRVIVSFLLRLLFFGALASLPLAAQLPDQAFVIQHIDATVKARVDNIASYTVTEHYSVYRNNDETHRSSSRSWS